MTVTTRDELEEAVEAGEKEIVVEGELAEKLYKTRKLMTIGGVALAAIVGAVGSAPVTGGISLALVAPVAAMSGVEIAIIIMAAAIGIGLILAIYKDYDVEVELDGEGRVRYLRLLKKDESSDS